MRTPESVPLANPPERGTVGQTTKSGTGRGTASGTVSIKALALKALQSRRVGQAVGQVVGQSVPQTWDRELERGTEVPPKVSQPCPSLSQENGTERELERVSVNGFVPLSQLLLAEEFGQAPCLGCGRPFSPSTPARVYCSARCYATRRPGPQKCPWPEPEPFPLVERSEPWKYACLHAIVSEFRVGLMFDTVSGLTLACPATMPLDAAQAVREGLAELTAYIRARFCKGTQELTWNASGAA